MKNKLLGIIFTITALIFCFAVSASAELEFTPENVHEMEKVENLFECYAMGDVNNSGSVMADDARLILRYAVNLETPDERALLRADIDNNGEISAADARQALRYAVKLDDEVPDHKLVDITISQVSCGTDGISVRFCKCCEKVYAIITTTSSSEEHISGSWKTIRYPDCLNKGLAQRRCVKCDAITDEIQLSPTSNHTGEWTYPKGKSCTEVVPKERTCEICGIVEKEAEQPRGKCKLKTVTEVPATCTQPGVESLKCEFCGAIDSVLLVPAKGHSYESDNYIVTQKPTCSQTGYAFAECSECNEKKEIILEKTQHSLSSEWSETLSPTCTENGLRENECIYCGHLEEVIPAFGHTVSSWTNVRPATCYETGLLSGECSVCHTTAAQKEIDKLPHDFDTTKPYTDYGIRCQEDVTGHYKCKNCNETQSFILEKVSCTNEKYGRTIITREATCTTKAVVADLCDYCNLPISNTQKEFGGTLGHSFDDGNWVVTKAATCTEKGLEESKCSREGCNATKTRTINAYGHIADLTKVVITKEATCSEEGTASLLCARCPYVVSTRTLPKTEHTLHTITKADITNENNLGLFLVTSKEECSTCKEITKKEVTISGIIVDSYYNDVIVSFDGDLSIEKGAEISFTLDNTPSNFTVEVQYNSEKTIPLVNDNGIYSFIIPEDHTTQANITIVIKK